MMKVSNLNGVKVYNLSAGATLPQFLEDAAKKKRSLKKDAEYNKRIELLQQFEFNIASNKVRVSPSGQFILASGVYPPEIRMFDVTELGMKFMRRVDSEVVDFLFLSDDYKKLVLLSEDRHIEFHSQGGRHEKVRVPKTGRAIAYFSETAELFCVGSSDEIWRFDCEAGMFAEPLKSEHLSEINFCQINPVMPLMVVGGSDGVVEAWDLRGPSLVSSFKVTQEDDDGPNEVTAAAFSDNGMYLAVGTAAGIVRVYDVRAKTCIFERDHRNGLPIKSIQILNRDSIQLNAEGGASFDSSGEISIFGSMVLVSTDAKSVKVWCGQGHGGVASKQTRLVASLELDEQATVNSAHVFGDSGLIFVAGDRCRIGTFFIPALGIAPKWAAWLDNFTEELEEKDEATVFDDLQFITRQQLVQWGAENLLGSGVLRPYMHGFFIDAKLYRQLKQLAQPVDVEALRKQKIQAKLEEKMPMRITLKQKTQQKVNQQLAEKLQRAKEEADKAAAAGGSSRKADQAAAAVDILTDSRFGEMFKNADFAAEVGFDSRELSSFGASDRPAKRPRRA